MFSNLIGWAKIFNQSEFCKEILRGNFFYRIGPWPCWFERSCRWSWLCYPAKAFCFPPTCADLISTTPTWALNPCSSFLRLSSWSSRWNICFKFAKLGSLVDKSLKNFFAPNFFHFHFYAYKIKGASHASSRNRDHLWQILKIYFEKSITDGPDLRQFGL